MSSSTASQFNYLLDKIHNAHFLTQPFKHIYIENFLSEYHFTNIIEDPQIKICQSSSPNDLLQNLESSGWTLRPFGGCTTDKGAYLRWRRDPSQGYENTNTAEGFGMVYKIEKPKSDILAELKCFLASERFFNFLGEKFNIEDGPYRIAAGCHKYLSGYEISPHPDQRNKALTYMLNINSDPSSEENNHHTHYMRLKKEYGYVANFWEGNPHVDRSWLPWGWCETVYEQNKNNSIVIFSPTNESIHAVKAIYNDLSHQRTQFYGNLWYKNRNKLVRPGWESLEIKPKPEDRKIPLRWKVKNKLLEKLGNFF